ncbi:hypothetical protein BVX95_01770 [archaeon D22]|nr:hypothetical protein BVX95_01770 [archaeon D22]
MQHFCISFRLGLGSLLAEQFVSKIKEEKLLLLLLLIASLSFIAIFFTNKLLVLLLISIISFAGGVRDIFVNKGINEHTDSHHRATVISVQGMSRHLMYAILAPLIGYVADIYTPSAAFLMMGIILLIFFIYYMILSFISKKSNTL